MRGVMDSYFSAEVRSRRELSFEDFCGRNDKLIQKYSLNFIPYLIMMCGGQRPQVYAGLGLPCNAELKLMEDNARTDDFFFLSTESEKRERASDAPFLGVPKEALKFLTFYVLHVRPAVISRVSAAVLDGAQNISIDYYYSIFSESNGSDDELALDSFYIRDEWCLQKYAEYLKRTFGAALLIHARAA